MSVSRFENVFLFHGKGGRPAGSVLQLEEILRAQFPTTHFFRPALLHGDPSVPAEDSLENLRQIEIPSGSVVIGISLGGLVAAKLQEISRQDLGVVCISSPAWADGVSLSKLMPNRLSIYSSRDEVITRRTERWPELAEAYDLPWLTHDTDVHKEPLAEILTAVLAGTDIRDKIAAVNSEQERKGQAR